MAVSVPTRPPQEMAWPVRAAPARQPKPPFETGDHLSRAEFERRYAAHPEIKKAELILRSEIFPGLALQPAAIWADDMVGLLAILQAGLATPEHATFAVRLLEAGGEALQTTKK